MAIQYDKEGFVYDEESDFLSDWENYMDTGYYTPDTARLQTYVNQDVFIYDNVKKGFGMESKIETFNPKPIGIGWTSQNNLAIYRHIDKNGKVNGVLMENNVTGVGCQVYGEIYRVETAGIIYLDWMYSNGTRYKRSMVPIKIRRGDSYVIHPCWVYFAVKNYWTPKLGTDLFIAERVTSSMYPAPYYNFMKKYVLNS